MGADTVAVAVILALMSAGIMVFITIPRSPDSDTVGFNSIS